MAGEVRRALERRAAAVRRDDAGAFRAGLAPAPRSCGGSGPTSRTWRSCRSPGSATSWTRRTSCATRPATGWASTCSCSSTGTTRGRSARRPGFRFVPARHGPDRLLLASVSDRGWERRHHVSPQPWDEGPVEVRTGAGVLGVFDARSVADAPGVIASVESRDQGRRGARCPTTGRARSWSTRCPTRRTSTASRTCPGDDPARLDAVAFPVASGRGGRPAATRFLLSPAMLRRPGPERDRLVRHELTHVAVGEHDDRAPAWLAEGIAEWVSVRPIARPQRVIPAAAVAAARRGFDGLPEDDTFNDADARNPLRAVVVGLRVPRRARRPRSAVVAARRARPARRAGDRGPGAGAARADRARRGAAGRPGGRLILATYAPAAAAATEGRAGSTVAAHGRLPHQVRRAVDRRDRRARAPAEEEPRRPRPHRLRGRRDHRHRHLRADRHGGRRPTPGRPIVDLVRHRRRRLRARRASATPSSRPPCRWPAAPTRSATPPSASWSPGSSAGTSRWSSPSGPPRCPRGFSGYLQKVVDGTPFELPTSLGSAPTACSTCGAVAHRRCW